MLDLTVRVNSSLGILSHGHTVARHITYVVTCVCIELKLLLSADLRHNTSMSLSITSGDRHVRTNNDIV